MRPPAVSRRSLLLGSAAATAAVALPHAQPASAQSSASASNGAGQEAVPFHGLHQAGVETPLQAHGVFIGLDLARNVGKADLARLMKVWTGDAERLTKGQPALADTEPELAVVPARLTATIGFGPGVFQRSGLRGQKPDWLQPLPEFAIDRLKPEYTGADLLLQLAADDPITLAHAQRMMIKDAAGFAQVRWAQRGFHRAAAHTETGATGRNLMGQLDGTVNPQPETGQFDELVWISDGAPAWLAGGTGMVLRRIRMKLDDWDALSRPEKEMAMGRRLDTGAPLTGSAETDLPDFAAKHNNGFDVIPETAHVRAAAGSVNRVQFLRRPFNYDDGFLPNGNPDLGLLFAAYAANLETQFTPVQRRLAKVDLLNLWTVPIGSAVFAIPPGCDSGGFIGETLLS
ncbi:MAG: Dyp-type peroxidase [Actinomycetia bacterium]|nr:Dyp-type peroxidase [Actinomycetes bacterium]